MPPVIVFSIHQRNMASFNLTPWNRHWRSHHDCGRGRPHSSTTAAAATNIIVVGFTFLANGEPTGQVSLSQSCRILEVVPLSKLQANKMWVKVHMRPISGVKRVLLVQVVGKSSIVVVRKEHERVGSTRLRKRGEG